MGSGTLCLSCIPRMDSPAPEARRGCRLSLPLSSALAASAACEGFLWAVICFVWAVTCMRRTPRHRRELHAGSTRPLLCAAIWRRRFLWEVGTSYNERRLLWEAVRFVWAVTGIRTAPPVRAEEGAGSACGRRVKPGGPARFHAAPRQYGGRGGFFWAAVRFVWAVTGMRRPPRRRRELHAGSTRPHARRAKDSYGR